MRGSHGVFRFETRHLRSSDGNKKGLRTYQAWSPGNLSGGIITHDHD